MRSCRLHGEKKKKRSRERGTEEKNSVDHGFERGKRKRPFLFALLGGEGREEIACAERGEKGCRWNVSSITRKDTPVIRTRLGPEEEGADEKVFL